jgi:hypothetical protein
MKTTDRPKDTDDCARTGCGHEFGAHYISHDRKIIGCGWTMDDQRDGFQTCSCDGFLIEYTYPKAGQEYGDWRDDR